MAPGFDSASDRNEYKEYFPGDKDGRLRSGSSCYHSVQNLLSSRLLSKYLKIKIYRTIILPFFFLCIGAKLDR